MLLNTVCGISLSGLKRSYLGHGSAYTVTVKAVNKAGLQSVGMFAKLQADNTPPLVNSSD